MFTVAFTLLIFVLLIGLAVFLIVLNNKKEKERTQAMQTTAAQLGWNFAPIAPWSMIGDLDRFALFSQGHGKKIQNVMYGEASGVKAALFELRLHGWQRQE